MDWTSYRCTSMAAEAYNMKTPDSGPSALKVSGYGCQICESTNDRVSHCVSVLIL